MDPGQSVAEYAKASSTSALLSRAIARTKGRPVPFMFNTPVRAEEDGVYADGIKITQLNKFWMYYDNILLLVLVMPAGFVWFMNRVPK
eukprot:CAMPEP_0114637720 /NCGR_PEP_ID=MMETSP0191-20121206/244_1 /TAXON_ID=126664 /ORGANISM="Sorites sp." /LENGTH=87 /DNA_ID=CAMNT_0001849453 /DNA_START=58 /DNA_END=321 /DNA_ORIENTATION=+